MTMKGRTYNKFIILLIFISVPNIVLADEVVKIKPIKANQYNAVKLEEARETGEVPELLPIFNVTPVYPRRAAERGISGYVTVEFNVNEEGTPEEINVVESKCSERGGTYKNCSTFNSSALRAAAKMKYVPLLVNEVPTKVLGIRHKFTFDIAN